MDSDELYIGRRHRCYWWYTSTHPHTLIPSPHSLSLDRTFHFRILHTYIYIIRIYFTKPQPRCVPSILQCYAKGTNTHTHVGHSVPLKTFCRYGPERDGGIFPQYLM